MYTNFDEAMEYIDAAENDVRADFGQEAIDAGAMWDVIRDFALTDCDRETGDEVLRCVLGVTRKEVTL
jgi:hypothetical protein